MVKVYKKFKQVSGVWDVLNRTSSEQQQFSNIPRFRRLQKLKLRTHEEDNSDIGTRKTGKNAPDVQW